MRPINVSLDNQTYELAKRKKNFSQWIRMKLMEEVKSQRIKPTMYCSICNHVQKTNHEYCINKSCEKYLMHKLVPDWGEEDETHA